MADLTKSPPEPNPQTSEFGDPWSDSIWREAMQNMHLEFGEIRLLGISSIRDRASVELGSLYVSLRLESEKGKDDTKGMRESEILYRKGRIVVLGDPGAGKTTLISMLISNAVSRGRTLFGERFGNVVPIPMILRTMAIRSDNISVSYLLDECLTQTFWPMGMTREQLESMMATGQALMLLDGIDEIGSVRVRRSLRRVIHEMMHKYPNCRWVMTSRVVGYDEVPFDHQMNSIGPPPIDRTLEGAPGRFGELPPVDEMGLPFRGRDKWMLESRKVKVPYASIFRVQPFDDDQIRQFSKNWYAPPREPTRESAKRKSAAFLAAINEHETTRHLAGTPNLLTIMALVYLERTHLPDGRALLYDDIAEAYLYSIDQQRQLKDLPVYQLTQKMRMLAEVGMQMQLRRAEDGEDDANNETESDLETEKEILASKSDVVQWIQAGAGRAGLELSPQESIEMVEYFAKRSGLLIPRGADREGNDLFAFLHLSFQEYFAAQFISYELMKGPFGMIAESATQERLKEYANQSVWREVLVFLFELKSSQPDVIGGLIQLLFGPEFAEVQKGSQHNTEDSIGEPSNQPLEILLAELVMNRHSGLSRQQRRSGIRSCFAADQITSSEWPRSERPVANRLLGRLGHANPHVDPWEVLQSMGPTTLDLDAVIKLDEFLDKLPRTLETVFLSYTSVSDLAPLAGCTALRSLSIGNTSVKDLAPLDGCTSLRYLSVGNTSVSDLAPLAGCTSLQHLSVSNTSVSDLGPLAGCTALQRLSLGNTSVSDLAPLSGCTALQNLSLRNTSVSDLAALAGCTALQTLHLDNTSVSDLAPLAGCTALRYLSLNNTSVRDLGPLAGRKGLNVTGFKD